MIVYIDDIMILAESKDQARDHGIGLVYLLKKPGVCSEQSQVPFRANANNKVSTVNSPSQELSHPTGKIRAESWALLEGRQVPIWKLSKLGTVTRAVPLAPLFFRKLQRVLRRGLEQSDKDYAAVSPSRGKSCNGGSTT
jgi:hypothetical protein